MSLYAIPADEREWRALRARHVGASEVAALYGAQPDYAPSLYVLWHVKAGLAELPPASGERVEWGLRIEEAIAQAAAEREGWTLLRGRYASHDCGLGATLDRIIADGASPDGAAGCGVLELKNVDRVAFQRHWKEEPPLHILLQLQAQLLATGFRWGAIAALVGGNELRVWRYTARPKLHADMERRVRQFWEDVRAGRKPPVDGSAGALEVLRQLSPDLMPPDNELDMTEDAEAAELVKRLADIRAQARQLEKQESEAKARLLEKLGRHARARGCGFVLSQAVTAAKPARPAEPGEMIPGRAETRRLIISETGESE